MSDSTPAETPVRVAIVDDHGIVRQGLRALLTRPGIEVVGEASNGNAAIDLVRELQPDVLLLDIRMEEGDGLSCLPGIKKVSPDTSVIMLTTYANPGYLARSIYHGAAGYLSKDVDPAKVVKAVRSVAAGEEIIDRTLLRAALAGAVDNNAPEPEPDSLPADDLSNRETEVLQLIAAGMTNAEIGETLTISVSTVKTHVRHILEKLHVSDRTQAALWAVRNQVVV